MLFLLAFLVYWLCRLYIIVLLVRVVLDFVQIFKRDWIPEGIVLLIARLVYILTDPPLRFLARFIPPLRFGGVALDVGFIVLFFAVQLLQTGAFTLMITASAP